MDLTLTELRVRVTRLLMDSGSEIWPADVLDEAIRQALSTYSQVFPCLREAMINIPANGDLDLSSLPGLSEVVAVRWPYAEGKTEALQPVNRVTGWRCWRELDRPILELRMLPGIHPAGDDPLYIQYTCGQAINGLDGATVGTIPAGHCALLARGSAAYAALFRAVDRVENRSYGSRRIEPALLQNWGEGMLEHFQHDLETLRRQRQLVDGKTRWRMDQWDTH
jgi:hypothetical protein